MLYLILKKYKVLRDSSQKLQHAIMLYESAKKRNIFIVVAFLLKLVSTSLQIAPKYF